MKYDSVFDEIPRICISTSSKFEIGSFFPLKNLVATGFGTGQILCDGREIFNERDSEDWQCLQKFEEIASYDPNHQYLLVLQAWLWDGIWERSNDGWRCVYSGGGFVDDDSAEAFTEELENLTLKSHEMLER